MSPARHRWTTTCCAVVALFGVLTGCVPDGLAFRTDDRLTIVRPPDRSTVSLPVTLEWDIRDFDVVAPGGDVAADEGFFAVFVDTVPVPPGKPLSWVARKDDTCRPDAGCPDEAYLAARGIYTTTETELTLEQVPRTNDDDRRERHRATIVLLDASGTRIGESAFEVAFDIDRTSS